MQAHLAERETFVYLLKVIDAKKVERLKSSASGPTFSGDHGGYRITGVDMGNLLQKIGYYQSRAILIDSTEIHFPIDIEIDAPMLSLEEINAELMRQGLQLQRSKKLMKYLVVTDQTK